MNIKMRIFIVIIIVFVLVFIMSIAKLIVAKEQQEKFISQIPIFSFTDMNGKSFSNRHINENNQKFIINYFSPNCEHCQSMARQYVRDSNKLKNVQIMMVTSSIRQLAVKFINDYEIKRLSNVNVVIDTNYQFQQIFKKGVVPSFFIYEKDQLVNQLIGDVKIDLLLQ